MSNKMINILNVVIMILSTDKISKAIMNYNFFVIVPKCM